MTRRFTIIPKGAFSLERLAMFGFGHRHETKFDGVMRLAFCVDGDYTQQIGIGVSQDGESIHCSVEGDGDLAKIQRQLERILSLDYDYDEFLKVGERDPIIGELQKIAPGLRPPQFYSPYEAAVWSIISARRPATQMAKVRDELSREYGRVFELAGQEIAALPTPEQLLAVTEFPGLGSEKIERLHGVAQAVIDGKLDIERIKSMTPDEAMTGLQQIKGIGPFYSALIVIRGCGLANVLPDNEPGSLELIRQLYGLSKTPTTAELNKIAEPWKPFRTWATVYIRAVGPKLGSKTS
jgi:DNA-3-methyladenine glycosylase II